MEVGKTYRITHTRKGTFTGRVLSNDGEWAEIEVTDGVAEHMVKDDVGPGGRVNVRLSQVAHAAEVEEAAS